jgi:hypothetical protein
MIEVLVPSGLMRSAPDGKMSMLHERRVLIS